MNSDKNLKKRVAISARENGISSVLMRNAIGRKLGLNIADMECLSLLYIKGISTPTELANYTGLTKSSATAMLDRLEKANLIIRLPNPTDRRGLHIEPSKEVIPLFAAAQKLQNELIDSYTDKQLEIIDDFLTRFTKNIEDYTKEIDR